MPYNEELAERMRRILKSQRTIVEKRMFGGIGFMVNGNFACGVHKQDLIARLNEVDFQAALKKPHVRVFNMTGRPMKGWLMISAEAYSGDKALRDWITKSLSHAQSLPPK